jgi:hypothetical protein
MYICVRSNESSVSGRWESNPKPNLAKSLIILVHRGRLASNGVQHRGYLLDSFPVRVAHDMSADTDRSSYPLSP